LQKPIDVGSDSGSGSDHDKGKEIETGVETRINLAVSSRHSDSNALGVDQ
jgi:hypothetical protein